MTTLIVKINIIHNTNAHYIFVTSALSHSSESMAGGPYALGSRGSK